MSNQNATPFADIQKGGIIVLPWLSGMTLGGGYDSLTLVPKGEAYDNEKTDLTLKPTSGSSSQTFTQNIRKIENSSQLNNALSMSASVNGSYGVFSGSASATYEKSTEINNYSLYFLINSFVRNSEEQITNYELSEDALSEDGNTFREKYGDYFVDGVVSGGTLYALLNLSTNSRETKEKVTTSMEASYSGSFSIGGKFSSDLSKALKTSGVSFSSKWQSTGASPHWNSNSPHDTVDEIMKSANTFPEGVANGGAPMFAILKPYALLDKAPQKSDSINGQALNAIRQTLTDIYLQAKQILDSVNYALDNPTQFPPDNNQELPKIRQEMTNVMSEVIADNQQLEEDPGKQITLPKMPSLSQIPQRLWGGKLQAIAPPSGIVPTTLRYKLGVTQTDIWQLPASQLKDSTQNYFDTAEKNVVSNLNNAYNFIVLLTSSINALDAGISKVDAQSLVQALSSNVEKYMVELQNNIAQQKAQYASFSGNAKKGELDFIKEVLNPVLWDTTSEGLQYGGVAYWQALKTDVTDPLNTIIGTWSSTGTSKGSEYYSFKSGLWNLQQGVFKDAIEAAYTSVPN